MNPTAMTYLRTLTILGFMALAGGCSTFERDWTAAANLRPSGPTDITGRWQGEWASNADGHSGNLRCLITQGNKDVYTARFSATYGGIFRFDYDTELTGHREGDWIRLEGEHDLGPLAGGVYHYEAHANASEFFATYRSDDDNGRFTLKRPTP